ncbi:coiled-coil domain-containing protein 32 [Latimeria chalumnae]|uniref:coiled-coil domain-containing protein 32 n=1 Tax=Latimeria chalumnae TaxID=7897 RepID=UPI0006D8EFBD|nr:PREDICTED: uncharacterized protein C15orf57 homolog [Latimeria chalumnae]|eukprot:XP_014340939.1 PREDICTED: uncharacterized protein C15orf57 homolog [Latimeria chalumnae]
MIDNGDSRSLRPGQDLWAEICSQLPQQSEGKECGDSFADSFADSFSDSCSPKDAMVFGNWDEALRISDRVDQSSWAPMADSELYLAALENRLRKIKGLTQEVTSKDMLRSLAQAKKECWDRFLLEKFESDVYVEGFDSEESAIDHLKRWIQPDRVAVSAEEMQYLILRESQEERPETEERDSESSPAEQGNEGEHVSAAASAPMACKAPLIP